MDRLKRATEESWVKWMGDTLGESLSFDKHMRALQQVLAIKRYERDDTSFKVSLLVDVYATEKSWFDDDQR